MAENNQSSTVNSNSQNFFFHNLSETPTFEALPGSPEELINGGNPDQISDVSSIISSMSGSSGICNHSCEDSDSTLSDSSAAMSILRDVKLPTDPKDTIDESEISHFTRSEHRCSTD